MAKLLSASATTTIAPGPRFAVTVGNILDRFAGVGGRVEPVVAHLATAQVRLAPTPRLQLASWYQHNAAEGKGTWHARLAWEFQPLSFVYLIFNSQRPTEAAGSQEGPDGAPPAPSERQLVGKVTYLLGW